jgi:hypothetical protein
MKKISISLIITCLSIFSQAQVNNTDSSVVTPRLQVVVNQSDVVEEMRERYEKHQRTYATMPGYRIQYFAGSRTEAFKAKSDLLNNEIGLSVIIEYEQPYFKTKIGNFRTELDAERALRKIGEKCGGCFVIRDQILYLPEKD